MKCFLDFKPGGGLCNILAAVFRFKTEQGWSVRYSCCAYTYVYYTCPRRTAVENDHRTVNLLVFICEVGVAIVSK